MTMLFDIEQYQQRDWDDVVVDPAWDDGSAFPNTNSKASSQETARLQVKTINLNQVFIPAYSHTNWLSSLLNTQVVCFWKMQDAVLPVEQTSSTQSHKQPPSILPVKQTSSTTRRSRGEGTGRIHWRTITKKNGKQYQQAWYDWQHCKGKTISKSTYIPKRLLSQVQQLEAQKAPVRKILKVLGVT
ncbi:MAG: hypothetical protein HC917_23335 [Richelia sp. SM2_1_7]|nr:hypothetical protein [Richelia sp. SM2_1_7]